MNPKRETHWTGSSIRSFFEWINRFTSTKMLKTPFKNIEFWEIQIVEFTQELDSRKPLLKKIWSDWMPSLASACHGTAPHRRNRNEHGPFHQCRPFSFFGWIGSMSKRNCRKKTLFPNQRWEKISSKCFGRRRYLCCKRKDTYLYAKYERLKLRRGGA